MVLPAGGVGAPGVCGCGVWLPWRTSVIPTQMSPPKMTNIMIDIHHQFPPSMPFQFPLFMMYLLVR